MQQEQQNQTGKKQAKLPPEKVLDYYPVSYVVLYNAATMGHFFIGAYALVAGYDFLWFRHLFGLFYLLFTFIIAYVVLPLRICPHCPYFTLENSRCSSGLNIIANMITTKGSKRAFHNRGKGLFSYDNLFFFSLLLPLAIVLPAFIINFSLELVIAVVLLLGSLAFRIFSIVPKVSCSHCKAKGACPHYSLLHAVRKRLMAVTASGRNHG